MTSLVTLGGILILLGLGFWWAVDTGKRLNQAKSLGERVDKVANVIEFGARQTKKGVSAKVWGKRRVYKHAFIGSGKNSGKQLVFGKSKRKKNKLKALHGASLPREFHREDLAKIFNMKIKNRFPILFKRAVDFHLLKQRGGYDKSLPNNHITDPSKEGIKHDHINNVEASSSKFIKQGLFLFLFL